MKGSSSSLIFLLSFLLFVCLFLGSATSTEVIGCVNPYCVDLGGNCTTTTFASWPVCRNGAYCAVNDVCTAQVAVGSACNSDMQCLNGGIEVMCFNNTCQSVTRNQFAGQPCNQVQDCQAKFYCDYMSGSCKSYSGLNETCSGTNCGPGLACSYEGVCITSYSVPLGGKCDILPAGYVSSDCATGLFCNKSGICVKGFSSSNAACNSTVSCSNPDEFCQCNVCTAPYTVSSKQATAIVKLSNCVSDNNCDPQQPEKCCKQYQCTAHSLYSSMYFYKQIDSVSCGEKDPYKFCSSPLNKLSTGEKIAIIVGVSVGIVIIVVIIVYVVQRRRHHHYSEI